MRSIFILLASLSIMQGQETMSPGEPPSVRVHGEATVSADPDQAQLDIGVLTQGATAKAATDQNTDQANALTGELRALLPSGNIKTVNFSVNPNYRYPKEGPALITGYTANNTVRLLLDDISMLQRVIDLATKSGANSINRLTFMLHDEDAVRARALGNAATQARAGAEALADSLKLKLGRLLRVEEGQPVIISPPREINLGKAKSTDITPISPGTIDVHADVNLTYEIAGTR